ncbi:hypothetical protein BDR04DRAFT_180052 [Suillus decipiens]|nr:hypothetical protein BDR04DRAFT_180052 [Suillus decipiens]
MVQASWSSSIVPLFLMNRSKTLTDLLTIRRNLWAPSLIAAMYHVASLLSAYHTIPTVLRGPREYTDVSQVTRCEINAKSRVTVPDVGVRFNVRDGLQRCFVDGCTLSPFSSAGMVNSCFALRHPTTSHARELISSIHVSNTVFPPSVDEARHAALATYVPHYEQLLSSN